MAHVLLQQALADELLGQAAPIRGGIFLSCAIFRRPIVAPPQDIGRAGAAQDAHDVRDAEHLTRTPHAGKEFLRSRGDVHLLNFTFGGKAIVAETAGCQRGLLTEIAQQRYAAADVGLGVAEHRLKPRMAARLFPRRALIDELRAGYHITSIEQQQAIGPQPVASRPADLLIVVLEALRQVVMEHEPHVRFVDPHAEGDCGDDDRDLVAREKLLIAAAGSVIQARVVRQGRPAVRLQAGGQLIYPAPRAAVDNAGLIAMRFEEGQRLCQAVRPGRTYRNRFSRL